MRITTLNLRSVREESLAALRVLALLSVIAGLQACGCVAYSNRLLVGHCPPRILQLDRDLSPKLNNPVSPAGRKFGFITTPFKRIGILGWRDMHTDVVVIGHVEQAVLSTDHFITVDLHLITMTANGQSVTFSPERYLRAEICESELGLARSSWPCTGDKVRISGPLMWDGDGFLEVHPLRAGDVEILEKGADGQSCP